MRVKLSTPLFCSFSYSAIYAPFITPLSILKGSADVNIIISEKCEMQACISSFDLKHK